MVRTVNKAEYAAKRNEILDAAQRLIYTKGYQRMTIQDIRDELGMSNGAFFHYFNSKPAVLAAFIERIREETEKPLLPIVRDPHLPAIEKLQGFFATLERLRIAQKTSIVELMRVWYNDDNAVVRQNVDEAVLQQRAPLLNEIVRQGIREGVFTTPYPEQAGQVILSITGGMGHVVLELILAFEQKRDELHYIDDIVAASAATTEAIERVLGAPPHSLYRTEAEAVKAWVTALRGNDPA